MIGLEHHGDVTRVRLSTWRSRSIGYEVSVYLAGGVVIDCGFPDAAREIATLLAELQPAGAIITHGHEDHAGNFQVLARLGIPIHVAPETLVEVRSPPRIRFYRSYTWGQPRAFTGAFEPFEPAPFTLVSAPGHCPDHHVVWDAEHGTLFSADLWLGIHAKLVHAEESPRQLVQDLRAAAALAPERMFDSHRGPVHDPVRALDAKTEWLAETIGAIERRIDDGWSDRAIVRRVLGGEEWTGFVSRGEYARANFVRNVRVGAPGASSPVAHTP